MCPWMSSKNGHPEFLSRTIHNLSGYSMSFTRPSHPERSAPTSQPTPPRPGDRSASTQPNRGLPPGQPPVRLPVHSPVELIPTDQFPAPKHPTHRRGSYMIATILEALEDANWHILRDGLVIILFKTIRTDDDLFPALIESRVRNRNALQGSWDCMGQESFMVDLRERGIDADQLAAEVCAHLVPGDACWFLMSNSQGMIVRRVYG